jgi:hypothetical protein
MGRIKVAAIAVTGVVGLGLASAPSALAFSCSHRLDNFNRPASSTLGSAWTDEAYEIGIAHHRAINPNSTIALATYNGAKSDSACADVYTNGAAIQYVAIVLGYRNLSNNIFVKVQDNTASGSFNSAFAYRADNDVTRPLGTGNDYKVLTPFSSAEIYVTWSGSTVKLEISTKFNNKPQQKWVIHGVSTAGLGKKIGLGMYGGDYADNFAIP